MYSFPCLEPVCFFMSSSKRRFLTCIQISQDYTVEVRNRFKGLDLGDRGPEKLWTEVHNTVQEAVTKEKEIQEGNAVVV